MRRLLIVMTAVLLAGTVLAQNVPLKSGVVFTGTDPNATSCLFGTSPIQLYLTDGKHYCCQDTNPDLYAACPTPGGFTPNADPVVDHSALSGGVGIDIVSGVITWDPGEINGATWGDSTQSTMSMTHQLSGANDPRLLFSDGNISANTSIDVEDGGQFRMREMLSNGTFFFALGAAGTNLTANRVCTITDSSSMIPDSCVGDGVDGGAGAVWFGNNDVATSFTDAADATLDLAESYSSSGIYSLTADELTISETGTYTFTLNLLVEQVVATNRFGARAELEVDTGGGYANVPSGSCRGWGRNQTYAKVSCAKTVTVAVTTGDKFRVRLRSEVDAADSLLTVLEGTSLHVRREP